MAVATIGCGGEVNVIGSGGSGGTTTTDSGTTTTDSGTTITDSGTTTTDSGTTITDSGTTTTDSGTTTTDSGTTTTDSGTTTSEEYIWECQYSQSAGQQWWTCAGGTSPKCDIHDPAYNYNPGQFCPGGNLFKCVGGVAQMMACPNGCHQGAINTNDSCDS